MEILEITQNLYRKLEPFEQYKFQKQLRAINDNVSGEQEKLKMQIIAINNTISDQQKRLLKIDFSDLLSKNNKDVVKDVDLNIHKEKESSNL